MCGDTACPSCGPAQGCNPEAELVAEYLSERLPEIPEDVFDLIVDLIGRHKEALDLVTVAARQERERKRGLTVHLHWLRPGATAARRVLQALRALGVSSVEARRIVAVTRGGGVGVLRLPVGGTAEHVARALGPLGIGFNFPEKKS